MILGLSGVPWNDASSLRLAARLSPGRSQRGRISSRGVARCVRTFATRVSEGHYDTCLHWQTSSFGAVYPCWWRLEEKTPKADISGIDIVTEVCAIFPSESTGSQ